MLLLIFMMEVLCMIFRQTQLRFVIFDFFQMAPVINDKGLEWFGTKRLKAPEEYIKGSAIDEQTNIFTLGALIFECFGYFSDEEIARRYKNNQISSMFIFCLAIKREKLQGCGQSCQS